ncbi:uncharacterized protein LOC141607963 [Silene latifolia]|uniref:uncharacterized protein LOC141607963 n=1 Tax=Silene latifolia TaxID=37657 RepID=UPI003D774F9A
MFQIATKLKRLKKQFKLLNKDQFSDVQNNARILRLALKDIQKKLVDTPLDPILIGSKKEILKDYSMMKEASYSFLAQKAKLQWIKEGDDNTSYFHSTIKRRRSMNKVIKIEDKDETLCSSMEYINMAFEDYFKSILGESKAVIHIHIPTVRKGNILLEEHIESLRKPVTGEVLCSPRVIMKLDLQKAYDTVGWSFLAEM